MPGERKSVVVYCWPGDGINPNSVCRSVRRLLFISLKTPDSYLHPSICKQNRPGRSQRRFDRRSVVQGILNKRNETVVYRIRYREGERGSRFRDSLACPKPSSHC